MDVRRDDGPQPGRDARSEPAGANTSRRIWLLTIPGFAILLVFAVVATPVFGLLGCRTSGFFNVRCTSDLVGALMEPLFGIAMASVIFWPVTAPLVLLALAITGWRAWRRWRPRRA